MTVKETMKTQRDLNRVKLFAQAAYTGLNMSKAMSKLPDDLSIAWIQDELIDMEDDLAQQEIGTLINDLCEHTQYEEIGAAVGNLQVIQVLISQNQIGANPL